MQAAARIIPFDFETHEVRTVLIDDQPWFVASDICDSLSIVNTARALSRLDEDEKGVHSMNTLGGIQSLSTVNESGLYSLILTSRKAEAKRFKKWVTSEVLPSIRRHGQYIDRDNRMGTLVGEIIGSTELTVINNLIRDKAKSVPADRRRSFQITMHHRLHTRFNVPRTELIPADQFDNACNFVASYALEGEWLPADPRLPLDIHYPVESLRGVQISEDGREVSVNLPDLVKMETTPCEALISSLHKAGYDVEGAWLEIRTFRNKCWRIEQGMSGLLQTLQTGQLYQL